MSLAYNLQNYMVVRLNRKGRPAKQSAKRDSKGRARGEAPEKAREVAVSQPHRIHLPEELRLDQRAESPLGCYNLLKNKKTGKTLISDEQYEAGRRFAKVVARYRAAICSVDPIKQPIPGAGGMMSEEEFNKRKQDYDQAFEAIEVHKWQRAVSRVAIAEEILPADCTFEHLSNGLQRLVDLWGLTSGSRYGLYK